MSVTFRETLCLAFLIVAVSLTRLIPHPMNFAPMMSIALFSSAIFRNPFGGVAIAFTALLVSDAFLGFHSTMPFVYAATGLAAIVGLFLRSSVRPLGIVFAAVLNSILFFLITNLGVWLTQSMYPQTFSGLVTCYAAGIPFYQNTLAGEVFYSCLLFGVYYLIKNKAPQNTQVA